MEATQPKEALEALAKRLQDSRRFYGWAVEAPNSLGHGGEKQHPSSELWAADPMARKQQVHDITPIAIAAVANKYNVTGRTLLRRVKNRKLRSCREPNVATTATHIFDEADIARDCPRRG